MHTSGKGKDCPLGNRQQQREIARNYSMTSIPAHMKIKRNLT
jgi:hypothetical protein